MIEFDVFKHLAPFVGDKSQMLDKFFIKFYTGRIEVAATNGFCLAIIRHKCDHDQPDAKYTISSKDLLDSGLTGTVSISYFDGQLIFVSDTMVKSIPVSGGDMFPDYNDLLRLSTAKTAIATLDNHYLTLLNNFVASRGSIYSAVEFTGQNSAMKFKCIRGNWCVLIMPMDYNI